jgi:hypothetical protein
MLDKYVLLRYVYWSILQIDGKKKERSGMPAEKKMVTLFQLRQINNMLISGVIDSNEAKQIIARSRDPHTRYWEERFPDRGDAIMAVLGPLYGGKLELNPAVPDLEERLKEVVYWRKVSKIKTMGIEEWDSAQDMLQPDMTQHENAEQPFLDGVYEHLMNLFRSAIDCLYNQPLWGSRRNFDLIRIAKRTPRISCHEWDRAGKELEESFCSFLMDTLKEVSDEGFHYLDPAWGEVNVNMMAFYALGFTLLGDTFAARCFRSMIVLNQAGNFPIFFDRENNLRVLVAR